MEKLYNKYKCLRFKGDCSFTFVENFLLKKYSLDGGPRDDVLYAIHKCECGRVIKTLLN